jgi:hypothetical protein
MEKAARSFPDTRIASEKIARTCYSIRNCSEIGTSAKFTR